MNNDTQLKHFVWWIIRTQGKLPETYAEFLEYPLSEDVTRDIAELTTYFKDKYRVCDKGHIFERDNGIDICDIPF